MLLMASNLSLCVNIHTQRLIGTLGGRKVRKVCKRTSMVQICSTAGSVGTVWCCFKAASHGSFLDSSLCRVQKYPTCYLDERDNAWFFSIQATRSKQILIKTCANQKGCLLPYISIRALLIRVQFKLLQSTQCDKCYTSNLRPSQAWLLARG